MGYVRFCNIFVYIVCIIIYKNENIEELGKSFDKIIWFYVF